jgi:hypothetical protein
VLLHLMFGMNDIAVMFAQKKQKETNWALENTNMPGEFCNFGQRINIGTCSQEERNNLWL